MRIVQEARRDLKVGDEKKELVHGFNRIRRFMDAITSANQDAVKYEIKTTEPVDGEGPRVFQHLFMLIEAGLMMSADGGHPVYGLDCGGYRSKFMGCQVLILTGDFV